MTANPLRTAIEELQVKAELFPHVCSIPTVCEHAGQDSCSHTPVVIVAVSGGMDSVTLLHTLSELAMPWQLVLHVAHLDHALRADSAADAAFVADLAKEYALPFHCKTLQPGQLAAAGDSLEAAARQARYQFLAELAVALTPATQPPIVALAHHADDQAETVLHHLVRGSGLQGLGGMRPVTTYLPEQLSVASNDAAQEPRVPNSNQLCIRFIRPFLYVRRATILQYAQSQQLRWQNDSTNLDQRYTRNYLRHTVLPALATVNAHAVDAIGRLATLAAEESARLAHYDKLLLQQLEWPPFERKAHPVPDANQLQIGELNDAWVLNKKRGEVVLDLSALRLHPFATQRALLRLTCQQLAAGTVDISYAQLTLFCEQLANVQAGGPYSLFGELQWSVAGATAAQPMLLSIHRRQTLPFVGDQPFLPVNAIISLPHLTVGETARIRVSATWQLQLCSFHRTDLPADWKLSARPWRAFFDRQQVSRLQLATVQPGQRFAPLGLNGRHKQVGDLFTDRKVPTALRPHWPLLVDPTTHEVHWICGIQPGHLACIQAQTEEVLCLVFERVMQGQQ